MKGLLCGDNEKNNVCFGRMTISTPGISHTEVCLYISEIAQLLLTQLHLEKTLCLYCVFNYLSESSFFEAIFLACFKQFPGVILYKTAQHTLRKIL